MGGPSINRAESSGNIWTPWSFIHAAEARFGKIYMDLAASEVSRKSPIYYFDERENSLIQKWHRAGIAEPDGTSRLLWLNPPYSNIAPWAEKCAVESQQGGKILFLVPASIGSNWFEQSVWPYANTYSIGRLIFDNCFDRKTGQLVRTVYPKDLILGHYDRSRNTGKQLIFWKDWANTVGEAASGGD